jgi:membrane protein YdbS with pleckstrin-like domain
MRKEVILKTATFDAKLKVYWMASAQLGLLVTFLGIPLMPIWFFVGWGIYEKSFNAMSFELTERSLNIRKGFIFRTEKSIPLDKIQDVGMKEGPILRRLGLSSLMVETAGQSNPQGISDAMLSGVIDAPAFRDAILDQRDRVVALGSQAAPAASSDGDDGVLGEIRDSLVRIEGLLRDTEPGSLSHPSPREELRSSRGEGCESEPGSVSP